MVVKQLPQQWTHPIVVEGLSALTSALFFLFRFCPPSSLFPVPSLHCSRGPEPKVTRAVAFKAVEGCNM